MSQNEHHVVLLTNLDLRELSTCPNVRSKFLIVLFLIFILLVLPPMAKSDKVHKKGANLADKKANVEKVDTVTKPKKVKDDKKNKDKKVTSLVQVPVSSKEILAKAAVGIYLFSLILGLNHLLRKRSHRRR